MCVTMYRKSLQVLDDLVSSLSADVTPQAVAPYDVSDFNIEKVWRMQGLIGIEETRYQPPRHLLV